MYAVIHSENLKFVFGYNNKIPTVNVYGDTKLLFEATYEYIGIYNHNSSTWFWSWNVPFINKKMYKEIKLIKKFTKSLEKDYKKYNPYELEELYFYLNNNNYFCSTTRQDLPAKIALYLTKASGFIKIYKKDKKITEFILIKNINNRY